MVFPRYRRHPYRPIGHDPQRDWRSPLPGMSWPEAVVYLTLEREQIPFSWRNFDGFVPFYEELLASKGIHPEFTLREYETVIIVQGNFFGLIPSVIDRTSLIKATLDMAGWRTVILWENDLRRVPAWELLKANIPDLGTFRGPIRPSPWSEWGILNMKKRPVREPEFKLTAEPPDRREEGRVRKDERGRRGTARFRRGEFGRSRRRPGDGTS